ncbi:tricarballylate utilization 4Fe-4S protein TcuB [Poseidonocella sedimentorum]|uniref:Citrate/tricarballylate utilization protein n=1 Tax=Poseidonocella sedimentorum TaxID=871652 RepID=A0A1I6ED26_9RHOB|nr:tricarballylate utilization 4Fe-4S protein TcuB [Poseidonocella sedimentorum]SFR15557.1 citrate/tricarballylate utilization protein [Poseidonocella sedimentorum]
MSLDVSLQTDPGVIATDPVEEARRQVEICNACRYCEGFCAVFPAITRDKVFADGDITQFANLCHNCRGCYYACQYTAPHEFELNLPRALASARAESWERLAWPGGLARLFQSRGDALAAALIAGFALLFAVIAALPGEGEGFYAYLGHGAMVAIFAPAFLLPLAALGVSLRRYWREVGGGRLALPDWREALLAAGRMRNLNGGQGQGCNFEKAERFSDARRHVHQAVLYGFLLCFASTSSGTVLHYLFGMEAPYGVFSLPKLLGVPGGILLVVGCAGMLALKAKADPALGTPGRSSGERAFIWLLGFVGLSGLLLYAVRGTGLTGPLLALHLGSVLTFFLLTPYSKMAHGFYRMTALLREAQDKRERAGG